MEEVTYYAIFDWGGTPQKPMGLIRRRVVDGVIHDEEFRWRGMRWVPTEFFELYRLGHDDQRYEEISDEEAQAFIERQRRRT